MMTGDKPEETPKHPVRGSRVKVVSTVPALVIIFLSGAMPEAAVLAQDQLPIAPTAQALDEKGVDYLSLSLNIVDPGISIGTPDAGGLSTSREWTGSNPWSSGGWNQNYNYNLSTSFIGALLVTITLGDKAYKFVGSPQGNGTWGPPYTPYAADGTFISGSNPITFTDREGTVVTFPTAIIQGSSQTAASFVVKPSGERLTFTYASTNSYPPVQLTSVQSNFGYQIKFQYQSPGLAISKETAINDGVEYCSSSASTCTGLHNAWPTISYNRSSAYPDTYSTVDLNFNETVTDPVGNTRSFTITQLSSYTLGSGGSVMVSKVPGPTGTPATTYGYATWCITTTFCIAHIASVSDLTGKWSYSLSSIAGGSQVVRIDPNNVQQIINNNVSYSNFGNAGVWGSYITSITDGIGRTTSYQYDYNSRPTYYIPPEGTLSGTTPAAGYTQNTYDARGNVTSVTRVPNSGSALAALVYQAGYDASCTLPVKCNKPNWIKDANGNETDYTYDPTHGGVLSEMQPAPAWPALGTARPLTLTTWVQIYGWLTNSAGTLVQQTYPIWRIATKTECQTVAGSNTPACDPNAQQTLSTYQYGASGTRFALLVKGVAVSSNGVTLRTCYNYDIFGHKISETKPNARLGVCP